MASMPALLKVCTTSGILAMAAIAKMPEVVQTLSNAGIEAIGGSAAECHRAVLEEVDRLGKAVAQAGIQKE